MTTILIETATSINDASKPAVRIITFRQCEETGISECHSILEYLLDDTFNPAYAACHGIDWYDVTKVQISDTSKPIHTYMWETEEVNAQTVPIVSGHLCMFGLDALGYTVVDGSVEKSTEGQRLQDEYMDTLGDGDFDVYHSVFYRK